jgi:uncharacterized protein
VRGLVVLGLLGLAWPTSTRPSTKGDAPHAATATTMSDRDPAVGHHGTPNRLANEKSPYLLQHAYNPVDWYPWGDEAFEKAKREGKPIFLSIGYSTCHWCHVMERESFENDSVAALLNEYFVAVKVDREERPDVDRLYMASAQAMGLGGGWPLNLFLTPELKPFFGGTYFPPEPRLGHPGIRQVLTGVHQAWSERREEIEHTGDTVLAALQGLNVPDSTTTNRAALFAAANDYLERSFDRDRGGFGTAPKFPSTVNLNFLVRRWVHDPEHHAKALEMTLRQLDAMRAGGIHDHLGGGFHRYATDRDWLVPHFEKMLYDQAQIAWAYLEAYQITRRPEYAATARDIFDYVARDLTSPEGAFLSAEDADSEGEEGRFYVWTPEQISAALEPDDAKVFCHVFGVTPQGNFEHGTTILSRVRTVEETARKFDLAPAEVEAKLAHARGHLLEVRSRRVRPHRDDKVLAAWNGLMISAMARGARVLDDETLAVKAATAAEFAWKTLRDPTTGALKRRWRDGEAAAAGQLDDYAYLALGMLDLYEATHDPRWLERSVALTEASVERFWDEQHGAFFESPAGDPSISLRLKDAFDGAEMAGNSIAVWNLQVLGTLLDRRDWLDKAGRTFDYYTHRLATGPMAMPQMLVAMDAAQSPPRHIVIVGDPSAADTRALLAEFHRRFLPNDVLLLVNAASRESLAKLALFTGPLVAKEGRATAYFCIHYACRLPVTDPAAFAAQLDERPAAAVAQEGR